MENFIDYVMYALIGQNMRRVSRCRDANGHRQWVFNFGDHQDVTLVFDEADVEVIKYIAANRTLDDEERKRYVEFFELCR